LSRSEHTLSSPKTLFFGLLDLAEHFFDGFRRQVGIELTQGLPEAVNQKNIAVASTFWGGPIRGDIHGCAVLLSPGPQASRGQLLQRGFRRIWRSCDRLHGFLSLPEADFPGHQLGQEQVAELSQDTIFPGVGPNCRKECVNAFI